MLISALFPDLPRLQEALLAWFAGSGRTLPWRRDYAPYGVWISEIMLQQTRMERGELFWERWMKCFPDVKALAAAREEDVLKAWEGLGYYSRARNILKAARIIVEQHGGIIPQDPGELRTLPGIGRYTAAAVASIAYGRTVACVDANVERVLSRLCDLDVPVRQEPGRGQLNDLAESFIPEGRARDHNQAMMELGALVCVKTPRCPVCPLKDWCLAARRGTEALRPVLPAREARVARSVACGVLTLGDKIYVQRCLPEDSWGGLWKFPGGGLEPGESPDMAVAREFREENGFAVRALERLRVLKTTHTKYDITIFFYTLAFDKNPARRGPDAFPEPVLTESADWRWVTLKELDRLPMPAPHRRLARSLSLEDGLVRTSLTEDEFFKRAQKGQGRPAETDGKRRKSHGPMLPDLE